MADKTKIERLAAAWLAEAKRIRAQGNCDCGCGAIVTRAVRFAPGHDAKLKARYRKEIGAILGMD